MKTWLRKLVSRVGIEPTLVACNMLIINGLPMVQTGGAISLALLGVSAVGCSGNPTAPTADTSASAAFKTDARYDAAFFASFVSSTSRRPQSLAIFIGDTDDQKQPVPAETIESARQAAASLQTAIGIPVDVRPLAGANAADVIKAITVRFVAVADQTRGGFVSPFVPGVASVNYQAVTYDECGGLAKTVVRHELMHAMGFAHTDDRADLMFPELLRCDILPSPREQFHARGALGGAL